MEYKNKKKEPQTKHKINRNITSYEVRLVGENIENSGEVIKIDKALKLAIEFGLDLVEVSPNAIPPVVRITDYKKFLYIEEKKQKEMLKKQKENNKPLKEVQFSPNIASADIETKTKQIKEFLNDNHKVKIVMKFKQGRELERLVNKGELILLELAQNLEEFAKLETLPKLNGKMMIMLLNPKVKKS